jgi:spermidine synthase
VAGLVLAIGIVLPVDVAFLRGSRIVAGAVPGAYLPFPRQAVVLAAALLPVGLALGLLFQWTARRAVANRWTLAQAYAVESAGALLGGLVTVAWTHAQASTLALAVGTTVVCSVAGLGAWRHSSRHGRLAVLAVAAAAVLVAARVGAIDQGMTRWTHPFLVESRDSPYGRLTLTRMADQATVFENDALSFETSGADAELLAHVAALSHPAPLRMLLLGGGPEGVGRELLQHRPDRLDIVEVNVVLLEMARRWLPGSLPARSDVTTIVVDEPRRYLRTSSDYDLVVVSAPEPDSGQANRFYTTEFFGACAARLRSGGVLAFRLRTAENVWTPAQSLRFASVHRALSRHFPHALVLPGTVNVVLASQQALPATAAPFVARFTARGLQTRLVQPSYLEYLYSNDRREEIQRVLQQTQVAPNTDSAPVSYRYALVLWAGRFWPAVSGLDPRVAWAGRLGRGVAVVSVSTAMLLWWLARRTEKRRRSVYVAVIALGGMLLESVVLMHYQVTQGVVFQDIGMLTAAFMAGLAGGTFAIDRRPLGTSSGRTGVLIAVLLGVAALAVSGVTEWTGAPTLAGASCLLAMVGALVGAGFAQASRGAGADQRSAISPLYAADLVGGSVGAVMGGLLLIPLVGLPATALVGGALAVFAAALA